jgi:hypothetical protein
VIGPVNPEDVTEERVALGSAWQVLLRHCSGLRAQARDVTVELARMKAWMQLRDRWADR